MPLSTLYADHIGHANGNFEPQRINNALLRIVGLDSGGASGKEDDLVLALASFPIPKRTMGIVEIGYLNEKRKFAGIPTYDDLSVIYKDYVDKDIAQILWEWNYQVHNPETGRTGLARKYKKSGSVTLYGPNGDGEFDRVYNLIGIWPSGFDPGDADLQGEDSINITMTLTIDKVIPSTRLKPGTSA